MKIYTIISILFCSISLFGQGNCLVFPEGSGERAACELSYKALEHHQGSRESQMVFDQAIEIGPKYAWAYFEKSVPYFKRGFLIEGLEILKKAVELDPLEYLPYRASWYWQYSNYELCIKDLEEFYALPRSYPSFTPGGEVDMKLLLAMSYYRTNQLQKGITTIENLLKSYKSESEIGMADNYLLGVLYYKNKEYDKAIASFQKQFKIMDDFPDCHYYLGLAYKQKSKFKAAKVEFEKALALKKDPARYGIPIARIPVYEEDILKELSES